MEGSGSYVYPVVSAFVLLLCAFVAWLVYERWKNDKIRGYPPGPVGFPLVGYLPFLSRKLHEDFARLGKIYGDVIYLTIGSKQVVVLNSLEAVQEAFINQKDIFSGRGDSYVLRRLWNGDTPSELSVGGILMSEGMSEGSKWETLRRFAMDHIELGQALERVRHETVELIAVLESAGEKAQDARGFFLPAMGNMIMGMTTGLRKPYRDQVYQQYIRNFAEVSDLMHQTSAVDLVPLIEALPPYRNRMSLLKDKFQEKLTLISKLIQESSLAEHPTSFIGDFQRNGVGLGEDAGISHLFTSEELTMVMNDLWGASTETTTSTLHWAVFYMILHPAVQEAVHKELDNKRGEPKSGIVNWDDRKDLPFTHATIREIQRCASVAPLGVFRRNVTETKLSNYVIPEGCIIVPNLWNIHRDQNQWDNPLTFSPERFLDGSDFPAFLPFSLGSRSCPFQDIASAQLFVVFANLLHRFEFRVADGFHLPAETDYVAALTIRPKDFSFSAKRRFQHLLPDRLETWAA